MSRIPSALLLLAVSAVPAAAQWNPLTAHWGKTSPDDVRVMTWNVRDTLCSTNAKAEGAGDWCALARILAALQPDVLLLQECGDNSGHGTGLGVDPVTNLSTTLHLLLRGGFDPFQGAPVGAWVQKYAPAYDLPHVFVSTEDDGYNRNAILSRWPFADLNGDGAATSSDFQMLAHKWASGGDGGVRGFGVVEIDLPDEAYAGDIVVGNSHLKAGTSPAAHADRVAAARRIAYVIDHLYNGAGTGLPDPFGKVLDQPAAQSILAPATAFVAGGDWNENEDLDPAKGPAEWIVAAEVADGTGGTDGTDGDGSDMRRDAAVDWFTGDPSTIGGTKLDYLAWQDSLATSRREVVFDSQNIPAGQLPAPLVGFAGGAAAASPTASDHRPLFADLVLPAARCNQALDLGFAQPGRGALAPEFTVCGDLASGGSADFVLRHAPPRAALAAVVGLSARHAPFAGGTLVPAPDVVVSGLHADATGMLLLAGVPGGGGPFELHVQWVADAPGSTHGLLLSNALLVSWLP